MNAINVLVDIFPLTVSSAPWSISTAKLTGQRINQTLPMRNSLLPHKLLKKPVVKRRSDEPKKDDALCTSRYFKTLSIKKEC